jgi:hypothetical protein
MDNTEQTVAPEAVAEAPKPEAKKPSPAQDLRDLQALLVSGIYPGNVAPAIMRAYQLLEKMALEVESAAK